MTYKIDLPGIGYFELDNNTGETVLTITNHLKYRHIKRAKLCFEELKNKYTGHLVDDVLAKSIATDFEKMYFDKE